MNVLSLFDGMSCGMLALERAGIKVDNYYSSEVDKYAIQVSNKNYPNIIRLGDVTKWKSWDLPKIDLIIGGSPCQGFSFAGKQAAFDDPRSALFFEFLEIYRTIRCYNPGVKFMLENVKMKKQSLDVISDLLNVEPIRINSKLVSAQNRDRFYWTNVEGIQQPEHTGELLRDVLEDNPNSPMLMSDSTIERFKGYGVKLLTGDEEKSKCLTAGEYAKNGKHGNYLNYYTDEQVSRLQPSGTNQDKDIKIIAHRKGYRRNYQIFDKDGKTECLDTGQGGGRITGVEDFSVKYRKLTPIEYERLQTVPDNYTDCVSNSQRYKMLGNGWTVDVIAHIFKSIILK